MFYIYIYNNKNNILKSCECFVININSTKSVQYTKRTKPK